MKYWRAVAFLRTMWYRSLGFILLGSIHSLSSSPSWKTSRSILVATPMSGGLTWYVYYLHYKPVITSTPLHQLLGVARGVQGIHSLDIIHGNLRVV